MTARLLSILDRFLNMLGLVLDRILDSRTPKKSSKAKSSKAKVPTWKSCKMCPNEKTLSFCPVCLVSHFWVHRFFAHLNASESLPECLTLSLQPRWSHTVGRCAATDHKRVYSISFTAIDEVAAIATLIRLPSRTSQQLLKYLLRTFCLFTFWFRL